MANRVIKLPNGLFGRFSDVVDNFTDLNLTKNETLAILTKEYKMHETTAHQKIYKAVEDIKPFSNTKGSGLDRWYDSIQTIKFCHGIKEVKKLLIAIDGNQAKNN